MKRQSAVFAGSDDDPVFANGVKSNASALHSNEPNAEAEGAEGAEVA